MINIILSDRTDVDQYFSTSGVLDAGQLTHTPFLVFELAGDTLHVRIVDNAQKLLAFTDETQVMGQWKGDYRSDYFQFTVGQYRQYLDAKDAALLKTVRHVVKSLGPLGGFRSLSYEYTVENGTVMHTSTGSKAEGERLEALFLKNNVPVETRKESRR